MKRILCTGCGGSANANFIKSLRISPEPFYIIGVDNSKYHIKLSNADKNYLISNCNERNYIDQLNAIIKEENIEFVHPQPDPEVAVISAHKRELNANTFLPSPIIIKIAHDKYWFNQEMKAKKIPCPKSWKVEDSFQLKRIFINNKGKLWLRAISGAGSLAALPIEEYKHAVIWIDYWSKRGIGWGKFMISEFLPGKEYAFQSLWNKGKLITSAARERIEYLFQNRMPSGQSSTPTIAKSVHNLEVNRIATASILALDFNATGVYCVDLKENSKGVPCVTEINLGRFFTTSNFFSVAGSNMPYYYIKLAYKEELPKLKKYNAVPKDLYWLRQIDMQERMIKENEL